ncbi:MAG: hypothetical protein GSR86_07905 [Desulfurococcales archaeon]|nr:hypothetical protein [Desulfurococcales archaeon]
MNVKVLAIITVAALIVIIGLASAIGEEGELAFEPIKPEVVDHTEFFEEANVTTYEGSKSCISCHEDEVYEFFHSYHYQMASWADDVTGKGRVLVGGRVAYNDFCMAMFLDNGTKPFNWIGYVVLKKAPEGYEDLVGSFTGLTGCSMCHGTGMGLPPSWEASEEQLGNIDCLACHADPELYVSGPKAIAKGIKNVTKDEKGRFRYVVNLDITDIAKNIIDVPTTANCLACHAYSGGGPHLKRPNLGPDMYTGKTKDGKIFDVHIANGMSCVDCHPGSGHKFSTSSVDTWDREGERPGEKVRQCSECHSSDPHGGVTGWFLNTFHDKVACQTCHIPYIAHGDYPTEKYRDWSATTFHPDKKRWKFSVPDPETGKTDKWYLFKNLEPVYAWYNGEREAYTFPDRVEPVKDDELNLDPVNGESAGVVYYVKPSGDRSDPEAKIYPFKLHRALIPYSPSEGKPVPVKVGIAFATGNVKLATEKGANASGISWDGKTYVTYVRYMQVNHGVQPAENALECLNCHGPTVRRMPWPELGYGHFPEIAFTLILIAVIAVLVGVPYWYIKRR